MKAFPSGICRLSALGPSDDALEAGHPWGLRCPVPGGTVMRGQKRRHRAEDNCGEGLAWGRRIPASQGDRAGLQDTGC